MRFPEKIFRTRAGEPAPPPKDPECGTVVSIPGVCGGHAIVKGRRIEVSNVIEHIHNSSLTPEEYVEEFEDEAWITPSEIIKVLAYCESKQCLVDGITCCHCNLNPYEASNPNDEPFDGWKWAAEALARIKRRAIVRGNHRKGTEDKPFVGTVELELRYGVGERAKSEKSIYYAWRLATSDGEFICAAGNLVSFRMIPSTEDPFQFSLLHAIEHIKRKRLGRKRVLRVEGYEWKE